MHYECHVVGYHTNRYQHNGYQHNRNRKRLTDTKEKTLRMPLRKRNETVSYRLAITFQAGAKCILSIKLKHTRRKVCEQILVDI
jgi:hypothetical protein